MRVDEIVKASGAQILKSELSPDFDCAISTDSRTINCGDIYLPLKGSNFDGENFVSSALESGACGYFTSYGSIYDNAKLVLKSDDTLIAYLRLAGFYRNKINPVVIGVTGSSGKTTVKEMLYSVLSQKFKTVKTLLNHNNEIGFCQTVFSMLPDTEVLVLEMGMRGLGEISLISSYAKPDYVILTNVGTSHIGRLGSVENIARAKCESAEFLNPDGAFIALDQEITKSILNYPGEKVYFSIHDVNIIDKKPSYSKFEYKNRIYELNVEGDHNIENALSVIEVAYKLGVDYEKIREGLFLYHPIEKRWEIMTVSGFSIVNDSYNANPDSMKAAVKTFIELYDNPVVVLGDMGELGENAVVYHREVGDYIAKQNCKNVKFLTVGSLASEIGLQLSSKGFFVKSFESNEDVARYILDNLDVGNTIFLKASRAMKFEEIIEVLKRGSKI